MKLKCIAAISIGCIAGTYLGSFEWNVSRWIIIGVSITGCALLYVYGWKLGALLCIACACSIVWYQLCLDEHVRRTSDVTARTAFKGYISAEPEPAEQKIWYVVTGVVNGEKISIRARTDLYPTFDVGEFVEINGTIEAAEPFETETGIFDYPRFLYARGVEAVAGRVEVTESDSSSFSSFLIFRSHISAWIFDFKHMLVAPVERVLPPREGALILGMVYGMKKGLSEKDENAFKTSGLSHLVVLSGSNVAIVAAFLKSAVAVLPHAFARYMVIVPVSGVWLLVLMAGAEPSGVRAGIMATIAGVTEGSKKRGKESAKAQTALDVLIDAIAGEHAWKKIAVLSSVAAFMAAVNPLSVAHDPSYALSFMATFGVTFVAPVFSRLTIFVPMPQFVREVLSQTIAAQICTLPIILSMGGGQTWLAPVSNALAAPLVPIAMASGGAVSIFGLISKTTAAIPAVVAILSTRVIYAIAAFFAVE